MKKGVKEVQLTTGSITSHIISQAFYMMIGIISIFAFNLVDTYFVGQLGTSELAALTFTFPVVAILVSLTIGLSMGVTSVIARAYGKENRIDVKKLSTDALSLAFVLVSILALLGLATIEPLFSLLGAKGETLINIKRYMVIWYFGMPFVVIPMVGNGIIRALGNFSFPMMIMVLAGVSNIFLDYLFIKGRLGFPRLELEGAALATLVARAMTLILSLYVLHFKQRLIINPFRGKEVFYSWKRILHTALPSALMNTINPISLGVITSLLAVYGAAVVGGFGVGMRVEAFAMIPLLAVSSALNPIIAQNWASKKYGRVKEAMVKSFLFSSLWGGVVFMALYLFSQNIAGQFSENIFVQKAAQDFLKISPMVYLVEGIIMYVAVFFIAIGTSYRSMLISLFRFGLLYIPLAWLGGELWQEEGVYLAKVISGYLTAIYVFFWWRKYQRIGRLKV